MGIQYFLSVRVFSVEWTVILLWHVCENLKTIFVCAWTKMTNKYSIKCRAVHLFLYDFLCWCSSLHISNYEDIISIKIEWWKEYLWPTWAALDILGSKARTKNICVCVWVCMCMCMCMSVCVYVYVYVYVYVHVCLCLCACVFMFMCMCVYVYIHLCLCICVSLRMCTCMSVYVYVYVYVCVCVCACVFMLKCCGINVKMLWT